MKMINAKAGVSNQFTGDQIYYGYNWGARAKLLWSPSDATKVTLALDTSHVDNDYGVVTVPLYGTYVANGAGPPLTHPEGFYNENVDFNGGDNLHEYGISLKWFQDLGPVTFTSISAYLSSHGHDNFSLSVSTIDALDASCIRGAIRPVKSSSSNPRQDPASPGSSAPFCSGRTSATTSR